MNKIKNFNNYLSSSLVIGERLDKDYPVFHCTMPIKKMCDELISVTPGVYFFHDLRGIHYIGETSNLKIRFRDHINKEKNKKLSSAIKSAFGEMNFSWVKTQSKMDALILQKKWIRMFKPNCNIIKFKHAS
tara:strand:+ start:601 stop:993 length:393 start_codon:yes stop_codon:yes gene_type:complete